MRRPHLPRHSAGTASAHTLKDLGQVSILMKREAWRRLVHMMSFTRRQMKCRRVKRFSFFMFRDRAKRRLTPRMWLNAQFFVMEVAREALKKMTERATFRNTKS
jgi:hypothetical protein